MGAIKDKNKCLYLLLPLGTEGQHRDHGGGRLQRGKPCSIVGSQACQGLAVRVLASLCPSLDCRVISLVTGANTSCPR